MSGGSQCAWVDDRTRQVSSTAHTRSRLYPYWRRFVDLPLRPAMQCFATLPDARLTWDAPIRAPGESVLDQTRELEKFLADIERRAFRMAQIALRNEDDALDVVQDAMLKLVRNYAAKPAAEWRPLFYRILENGIRDLQRRRSVRGRLMAWMPGPKD